MKKKTRQVKTMRKRNLKCYISLNEAFELNDNIKDIFENVTLFSEKGFTSNKLFTLLRYEAGDRLINYKFPLTSNGIQVTQEHIEDIQTYVDLFTDKFKYKYLALIESEDFVYDPLDNTDITENKEGTRTPTLSSTTTDTGNGSKTTTNNLTEETDYNSSMTKSGSKTIDYGKDIMSTDSLRHGHIVETSLDHDTVDTFNTVDTTTYNISTKDDSTRTLNTKNKTTYNSSTSDDTDVTYGKSNTTSGSDNNTHSVSPYDESGTFYGSDKDQATNSTTSTDSGKDKTERDIAKTGYDELANTGTDTTKRDISKTGSDALTKKGTVSTTSSEHSNQANSGTDTRSITTGYEGQDTETTTGNDTHSGTDTLTKTGTITESDTKSNSRITSQTGTETNEEEMTRKGFQPQYSISSRQDMVNKYRDVSNFSAVDVYIKEVANYILLGFYSNFEYV